MSNVNIEVTEGALETIRAMGDEVRRLRMALGENHPDTIKAATSLALSMTQMFALKPTFVGKDGEHSLICSSEHGLTFGVNYLGARHNENGAGEWSVNS